MRSARDVDAATTSSMVGPLAFIPKRHRYGKPGSLAMAAGVAWNPVGANKHDPSTSVASPVRPWKFAESENCNQQARNPPRARIPIGDPPSSDTRAGRMKVRPRFPGRTIYVHGRAGFQTWDVFGAPKFGARKSHEHRIRAILVALTTWGSSPTIRHCKQNLRGSRKNE